MFTHDQIWAAFDAIAEARGLSISALAKSAGLDATSFNPSKRVSMGGRDRWPSTETLSKILKVTDMDLRDFADVIDSLEHREPQSEPSARPRRLRKRR
jgi:phage repressor protein C with HTH and peptisase S24 domain